MKTILYVVVGIVLLIFVGSYALHTARTTGTVSPAAVGLGLPSAATTLSTANLPSGEVQIDGTAILDTSSGLPAVPFISYFDANGRTRTKQLIYVNERGCFPSAGDLPCVPNYSGAHAYPQITTGQKIRSIGYIRDDRMLVTSLSVESTDSS